jgi:endonuclease/exonuclease/phosphatase family metal-dependent hydrolase
VLVAALAGVGCGPASAHAVELKLMSLNIRYSIDGQSEAAAENNWNDASHPRRERAIRVIRESLPDVLGVQEPRRRQVDDLKAALPEYAFYGVGRDDGKSAGEYAGIFWRANRFTRLDAGSFWLSDSPDVPGTSFSKAPDALPRIATWVKLLDRESGCEFVLLSTHWDHQDATARLQSARLIRERLKTLSGGAPVIVLGDFNSTEGSAEMKEQVGKNDPRGPQLLDSYRRVHPDVQPNEQTFHDYRGANQGARIDFILCTDRFTPIAADIVRTSYDGRWPSDHYPVTATLQLDAVP